MVVFIIQWRASDDEEWHDWRYGTWSSHRHEFETAELAQRAILTALASDAAKGVSLPTQVRIVKETLVQEQIQDVLPGTANETDGSPKLPPDGQTK